MKVIKSTVTSLICCCLLFSVSLEAQKKSKKADKTYEDFGYKSSIPLYENTDEVNLEDMAKIANSYRLNHDTENAAFWYAQVVEQSTEPQHYFYYAQSLQSNGQYDLAKNYYLKYDSLMGGAEGADQRGKLLAEAIERMNDFHHTDVEIKNESKINTDKLDFSPTYYKDGVIFVTTRPSKSQDADLKDIWIDDNFMSLFYATRNKETGFLENAEEFSLDLNTKYHEGPVCFSKNGERIFFTRNHFNKDKRVDNKDGVMRLQIYTASKEGDDWGTPYELPINTIEYEEAHPAISPDGRKLYFSSDRAGGKGGMDLYVSEFKGGKWNEPKNLGDKINTPGNEVFPFVHDDGTMYFASDGWGGLGGLDIFSTTETAAEEGSQWSRPFNIGTPFNSKKDDFGYVLNMLKTEGYLTSARANGNGQDDIYSFRMSPDATPKPKKKMDAKLTICAYEMGTETQLDDVQFKIIEKNRDNTTASMDQNMAMLLEQTEKKNEYVLKFKNAENSAEEAVTSLHNTDGKGEFNTTFRIDKMYSLVATKNGYQIAEEDFDGQQLEGMDEYRFCVPLKKMDCMSLSGVVRNKKYGNLIPRATVTMTSLCTGDDIVVMADADGAFDFPCIPCECDFVLKGEKNNLKSGASKENTMGNNCQLGTTISTEILLTPDNEKLEALFEGTKIEVGAVIELKNIYYDFDQYYIRDDAKDDLDNIVRLMHQYPSMVIELSSHTDARATDKYNEKLSQNRANAAVDYIISRGIARERLVPMGYGERALRNRCANFVDCTEEEHQNNRRTEVKVLRFDQKDIKVKEIDNAPETIDPANPKRKFRWN